MKVLVTGGAGFIGSTIAYAFHDAGDRPVILDDFSRGLKERCGSFPTYEGDVGDSQLVGRIFADHPDITLAVHCAAKVNVEESVNRPAMYYEQNVGKTLALVSTLLGHGCRQLLFSSSAAVYGATDSAVVTEDEPIAPETPYAASKAITESILRDICRTERLGVLALRYFNVIGCDPRLRTGPYDHDRSDVLGLLLDAIYSGRAFVVNGDDWPTSDGTPVRDFVHAWDLADAHVRAAHHWRAGEGRSVQGFGALNIGTGHPTTVRQLVSAVGELSGRPVVVETGGRRPGDIAGSCADVSRAFQLFGWRASRGVRSAVVDALRWAELRRRAAVGR